MPSEIAAPGRGRDAYYDGIRAVAIAAVIAVHWLAPYAPLFEGGYVGVDVFFVLSGFIITTILWRRTPGLSATKDYGVFIAARIRRLYPALLGVLIVGTLIVWAAGEPVPVAVAAGRALLAVVQAMSFTQGLGADRQIPFQHTWSLSVEWCFYLVWPLILLRLKRRTVPAERVAVAAAAVGLLLYAASLAASAEWFYYGPTSRAAQLLAGCSLSLWLLAGRRLPTWRAGTATAVAATSVVVIAAWTLLGPGEFEPLYRYVGFPIITAATVALCALPALTADSAAQRVIGWRPMAVLGLISYSLYLWHLVGIQVLDKDRLSIPTPALIGIALLGTGALTAASYRYLERPFMRSQGQSLRVRAAAAVSPNGQAPLRTR